MISVSKHVRETVTTMLSDTNVGFNVTIAQIASDYDMKPFALDFGPTSKNFFRGYYGPKILLETSNVKFPVMCVYTIKSQNNNQNLYATFSGSVMLGLDAYVNFPQSSAIIDTETPGDAVEDTFYNIFNSSTNARFWGDVGYNGDLTIQRGSLALGESNWYQNIKATMTFDLNCQ